MAIDDELAPDLRGAAEARLLGVERGIVGIDRDLRAMRRDILALQQGMWDEEGDRRRVMGAVPPPPPPPPPPTNTTFTGRVNGCNALALAGVTVVVNPSGMGYTTWTGTTDASGNYSGAIYLASNGTLTITLTPALSRQQSLTTSAGFTAGSSVTIATKTLNPASGYACTNVCPSPLRTAISVFDAHLGTSWTMAYFPTVSRWLGNHNGLSYALELSGLFGPGSGGAPAPNGPDLVSRTCVAPGVPTNWVYQYNSGHGGISYPNGSQFTITDPP